MGRREGLGSVTRRAGWAESDCGIRLGPALEEGGGGDPVALQMFPQRETRLLKRNCGAGSPPAHAFVLSTGRGPFTVWEREAVQGTSGTAARR